MSDSKLIQVRATVNLPKLATGQEAFVDPTDHYIAGCLERGTLVPVERPSANPHE